MFKRIEGSQNFKAVKERTDQERNDSVMRQSVARFLNESIRDVQQQDIGSMAGALRSSIAKQLRSSIALK